MSVIHPHQDLVVTPVPPTDLSATESTAGEVDLSWADDTENALDYVVTATPATGSVRTYDVPVGIFACAATGLTPDVAYDFSIVAVESAADGLSATSDAVAITAAAPAFDLSTGPSTVVEGTSTYALSLSATTPSDAGSPIDHYLVYWDDGSTPDRVQAASGGTVTDTYGIADDDPTTDVSVTAVDSSLNEFTLPELHVYVVPTAPISLTATARSSSEIDLGWTGTSSVAAGYEVLRADPTNIAFTQVGYVANTGPGPFTFSDTDLVALTDYSYEIDAVGNQYTSLPASPVASTLPVQTKSAAIMVTAMAVPGQPSAAEVEWSYNGNDDTGGYELEEEDITAGQNFALVQTPPAVAAGGTESAQIYGLISGDTYIFRMRADLSDGTVTEYAQSNPVTITELSSPDANVLVTTDAVIGRQAITLEWTGILQMRASWCKSAATVLQTRRRGVTFGIRTTPDSTGRRRTVQKPTMREMPNPFRTGRRAQS